VDASSGDFWVISGRASYSDRIRLVRRETSTACFIYVALGHVQVLVGRFSSRATRSVEGGNVRDEHSGVHRIENLVKISTRPVQTWGRLVLGRYKKGP
jgi:hypothetical protein